MTRTAMSRARCEQCGHTIRSNNKRAIFLFFRTGGRWAGVCGRRCLELYNEGDDVMTNEVAGV